MHYKSAVSAVAQSLFSNLVTSYTSVGIGLVQTANCARCPRLSLRSSFLNCRVSMATKGSKYLMKKSLCYETDQEPSKNAPLKC